MSQHVESSADDANGSWLPLTEYSVRSGISTSTIRRKIKSNAIPYRLVNGKYFIRMEEQAEEPAPPPPRIEAVKAETSTQAPADERVERPSPVKTRTEKVRRDLEMGGASLSLIDRAVKMVSEAFEQTMKEKDERISLLKEQNRELHERLNELKTLVQALEEKYEVRY